MRWPARPGAWARADSPDRPDLASPVRAIKPATSGLCSWRWWAITCRPASPTRPCRAACPDLLAEAPAEVTGEDAADDLIRGNVLGDERARPDDRTVADGHPAHDHGLAADPDVIAHDDGPATPAGLGLANSH